MQTGWTHCAGNSGRTGKLVSVTFSYNNNYIKLYIKNKNLKIFLFIYAVKLGTTQYFLFNPHNFGF